MGSEKLYPRVGVGVIILNDNGQILLGKRKGSHGAGEWALAGGAVEFGESIFETARRETKEETGLDIEQFTLVAVADELKYIASDDKHFVSIGFLAHYNGGEPLTMEPDKTEEWKWFDFDHLPDPIFEGSKLVIRNYKDKKIYQI